MTAMRTKPAVTALLAGIAALPFGPHASAEEESPYHLRLAADEYRLQVDSKYQLAAEYRRTQPQTPVPAQAEHSSARAPLQAELDAKPFAKEILLAASAASVDPALVHAVIHVESRYRDGAVSPKGALGLMQVMPDTAARYGVSVTRLNAKKNLDVGTRYLRDLMHMFDDRLDLVLAAYNAGEGAVRRYSDRIPPYPETQSYVRAVLARYNELGGKFALGTLRKPAIKQRNSRDGVASRR